MFVSTNSLVNVNGSTKVRREGSPEEAAFLDLLRTADVLTRGADWVLKAEDLSQGDLVPNVDFRGVYTTILEDWLKLDAKPLVNGTFEKLAFVRN